MPKSTFSNSPVGFFIIVGVVLAPIILAFQYWYVSIPVLIAWFFIRARINQKKEAEKARQDAQKAVSDAAIAAAKSRHRDSEVQSHPYEYQIGRHANETLAIRYGIANTTTEIIPHYYYAKGGEKKRNFDRDRKSIVDGKTINLRKTGPVISNDSQFFVELSDFGNRKAIAVIEKGTEYVKTFLPIDVDWFQKHANLELLLKGNRTMRLSEIAQTHRDVVLKSS